MGREAWQATVHGITRVQCDLALSFLSRRVGRWFQAVMKAKKSHAERQMKLGSPATHHLLCGLLPN